MLLPKPQSLALMFGLSFLSLHSSGQDYFSDSSRIKVSITSLNENYLEFSPVFYDNGLLFVTSKKKNKKNRRYFDIAYAPILENGLLGASTLFGKLNTKYHEGPLCLKNNLHSVFITRSILNQEKPIVDSLGINRLGIYEVNLSEKEPTETKLPFNQSDFSCAHPTLSQDETKLYFSSDRPGGFGGFDIWYSKKKGDTWGEPIHLGKEVNSVFNELFPVIYEDSTLFFASNRPFEGSAMGLDIYEYHMHHGSVSRLPSPMNSNQDDFGLILAESGKTGYFSSNRAGNDDIYSYEIAPPLPPQKIHFSLLIAENNAIHTGFSQQVSVANASVLLKSVNEQLIGQTNTKGWVSFEILPKTKYTVIFSKEQYLSDTLVVQDSIDFEQTVFVKTKKKPCVAYLGSVTSVNGKGLKDVTLTITDEFKDIEITTTSDMDGNYQFCLPQKNNNVKIQATKQGFMPFQTLMTTHQIPSFSLIPVASSISTPSFVMENIYYDFNESKIRENSADELRQLAQILKEYPSIKILLVAYTDSRGTKKYNERLARHRARAAKAFLVKQGIDGNRIKPVGRGEVNIRNRCKNGVKCSEEEHRYNRRTEVVFRNQPDELQLIRKVGVTD